MKESTLVRIGAVLVFSAFLFWTLPWLSPTRGVERAFQALIEGIEGNELEDVAAVVDPEYGDEWGLDKPTIVSLIQAGRRQFLLCEIEAGPLEVELSNEKRHATLRSVLHVEGSGSPLAQALVEHSRQSRVLTSFEWVRRSWKPWDWKLVAVKNPDAASGVRRLRRELGKNTDVPGL